MVEWEKHLLASASDEKTQRNYSKMVEWYGGKETLMESAKNPPKSEVYTAYQRRIVDIQKRLLPACKREANYGQFVEFHRPISIILQLYC